MTDFQLLPSPADPQPSASKPHPIQPLEMDGKGVLRFKENALVDYCVKQVGLNKLVALFDLDKHAEDWNQLAQLIGYSHAGSPSYLTDETYRAAKEMYESGCSEAESRAIASRELLEEAEDRIAKAIDLLNGDEKS